MKPHENNFCAGNYKDWLELMLLPECNGACSWCIEKLGYLPGKRVGWQELVQAALSARRDNIIILGGEPLLHPDIGPLVNALALARKNVYLTTNGRLLDEPTAHLLRQLKGINISIHGRGLADNARITGLTLDEMVLGRAIGILSSNGVRVRLNCNCIAGHVDTVGKIRSYVAWAKKLGAHEVRFAELKLDDDSFVDLARLFKHAHGLNDEPFSLGCCQETEMDGMKVAFRQMCGLHTSKRPRIREPEQDCEKSVLYYDGQFYDGWQRAAGWRFRKMTATDFRRLMQQLADGHFDAQGAAEILGQLLEEEVGDKLREFLQLVASGERTPEQGVGAIQLKQREIELRQKEKAARRSADSGAGCVY